MKKLILSVTMSAGFSLAGSAQGVLDFNSTGGTAPNGLVSIEGVLDTTTDINAELLASTSASPFLYNTFTPVAELLLSSSNTSPDGNPGFDSSDIVTARGDIQFLHNGHILDLSGSAYVLNAAPGTTEYFEVLAWTGNYSSFNQAIQAGAFAGSTPIFSEILSSPYSPILAGISNMPPLDLYGPIPEPAFYALATSGASLASMLFFRRRKS